MVSNSSVFVGVSSRRQEFPHRGLVGDVVQRQGEQHTRGTDREAGELFFLVLFQWLSISHRSTRRLSRPVVVVQD